MTTTDETCIKCHARTAYEEGLCNDCRRSTIAPKKERTEGRKKFLHLMFTTAIEGGIGYWSAVDEYHWETEREESMGPTYTAVRRDDLDNFYAIIESNEGDWGVTEVFRPHMSGMDDSVPMEDRTVHLPLEMQNDPLTVDIDVMERGWNKFVDLVIAATMMENEEMPCSRKYFRQAIIQWLTDGEDGDSDADVADIVVQLGLFGEVVYA